MSYRGVVKGGTVQLEADVGLPEGTEVEVVVRQTALAGADERAYRQRLGARMKAFSDRISDRKVNLAELVLEGRRP
ncbi:MAG: hypothetical protein FJ272_17160 [Planctomycetes bacterium]|nr:hypothetical protein [Planctomycetota bacterium]